MPFPDRNRKRPAAVTRRDDVAPGTPPSAVPADGGSPAPAYRWHPQPVTVDVWDVSNWVMPCGAPVKRA